MGATARRACQVTRAHAASPHPTRDPCPIGQLCAAARPLRYQQYCLGWSGGNMASSSEGLRLFSEGVAELYAPPADPAGQDFPARVVGAAVRLVPADSCSYNHFDGPRLLAWHVQPAGTGVFPGSEQLFRQHLPEHPVLACHLVTGNGRALRISDFLSDRQFRSLGLYCDFYRAAEVSYQLAITVSAPGGGLIGVALNRYRHDFRDADVNLLDLLRAHIEQAAALLLPRPAGSRPARHRERPAAHSPPGPRPAAGRRRPVRPRHRPVPRHQHPHGPSPPAARLPDARRDIPHRGPRPAPGTIPAGGWPSAERVGACPVAKRGFGLRGAKSGCCAGRLPERWSLVVGGEMVLATRPVASLGARALLWSGSEKLRLQGAARR